MRPSQALNHTPLHASPEQVVSTGTENKEKLK